MRKQNGNVLIGVIIAIAIVLCLAVPAIFGYVSAYNLGNRTENQLTAMLENNENIYANGTQKVIEIAQVPSMYAEQVSKVTREAIQGRYGQDGSKAVFQFLQEQNPQLDPAMFTKIQVVIEEFRNKFELAQRDMIDVKRMYNTQLGSLWTGFWLGVAGYPKVDMKKFEIVTTERARQTFDTKRDQGINLNQK
jgi:Tfp pilus assembly protein PilE